MSPHFSRLSLLFAFALVAPLSTYGQSVCLPSPRLLTTMPMGGQTGSTVEVKITGQHLEQVDQLLFSHPAISATPAPDSNGITHDRFVVTIAPDCPPGIHEARVMSRLGVSTARVFTVGELPESTHAAPGTSLETAVEIQVDSTCNSIVNARAVSYFKFHGKASQRILVDCSAQGIDSKMNPVVIVADAEGTDLMVERRGGAIDFVAPENGMYVVKVHDLTFKGGPEHFFRLRLEQLTAEDSVQRDPSTRSVSSFSWPPHAMQGGPDDPARLTEQEPNNGGDAVQEISLPCDVSGSFYPAADVDVYQFAAKKGETWWIETASERLGRPTDTHVVVQQVLDGTDGKQAYKDVIELTDIPSPIKRSSNGYSYDGPPYNAGSTDVLGKFVAPDDGTYQLRISDLFGGTRSDPRNIYRLVIRKATPDFALVAWALHMNLRNGDRNALSKPLALRGGSTMAMEVVAVRRDGFDGEILLHLEHLPEGVAATGFKIPAGKNRGILIVTADQDAPRGHAFAKFFGEALIDGEKVTRMCHVASMAWPVANAWSEIPSPRLVHDSPVSVGGSEFAALTLKSGAAQPISAQQDEKLTIPLEHIKRGAFSGSTIKLKAFGSEFESMPAFEAALNDDASTATIDLAKHKTPPGDYVLAFYGSAVAKYSYNPDEVVATAAAEQAAKQQVETLEKPNSDLDPQELAAAREQAAAKLAQAKTRHQAAKTQAAPKDIVDIYVSEPIHIHVEAKK